MPTPAENVAAGNASRLVIELMTDGDYKLNEPARKRYWENLRDFIIQKSAELNVKLPEELTPLSAAERKAYEAYVIDFGTLYRGLPVSEVPLDYLNLLISDSSRFAKFKTDTRRYFLDPTIRNLLDSMD